MRVLNLAAPPIHGLLAGLLHRPSFESRQKAGRRTDLAFRYFGLLRSILLGTSSRKKFLAEVSGTRTL
ncbi:unnamed protein product [Protopolystoma xenopodis]|uniref:Uncharacterized protein n=1 Tax=Protopolystoma xenopodis TaxID=117903 RepID=A0A3S5BES8_9PLAT|nr:unnamed protein product [Protopolystoma xenopodis]